MAATTVRLNKGDAPSWGFRLQGGKDFGTPLVIQKVNGGSPAERAGLIAGDAVIRINNVEVYNLLHKEAQDVIVRAGNSFEMAIQRGGSTWKPSVVPTGTYSSKPSPSINNVSPVTKTSLAAVPGENIGAIGTGHNLSAKPFAPQVNGAVNGGGPKLVNKQYNTPVKLYSEDAIAETISAQSEVLSTGALGVNFKKNEKNYDSSNSAVYRMLKEAENEPNTPEQEPDSGIVTAPNRGMAGLKHVEAPQNKLTPSKPQLPPGQNICVECERLIVGVFVRIKDKNLHVECFKCSTCGSSLKNVGYYNINNKLYCDVHAKSAAIAINNPSAVPITISPVGKVPASAISAALSSHTLPSPSPLSPKVPSYAPSYPPIEHLEEASTVPAVADALLSTTAPSAQISSESNISPSSLYNPSAPLSFSKYINKSSNVGAPKPFSSVSAPLSPGGNLSRAAPLSPPQSNFTKAPLSPSAHSYGSYSPASTGGRSTNIIWPPPQDPDLPTACPLFYPPPSRVEAEIEKKQIEKQKTNFEKEYFAEEQEDANLMDEMSYYSEEFSYSGRKSATECAEILAEHLDTQKLVENVIKAVPKIENSVPQKWESKLTQAVRTTEPDSDTFCLNPHRPAPSPIIHRAPPSPMVSALAIAPSEPFHSLPTSSMDPVPLPEMTEPYFPPEHPIVPVKREEVDGEAKKEAKLPPPKPYSPFVKALEIAPERPFTPTGVSPVPQVKKKPKDPLDELLDELPKPSEKLDMRSALMVAPDRSYTPLITEHFSASEEAKEVKTKKIDKSELQRPLKPEELPASFQMSKQEPKPPSYYAPAVIEERIRSEVEESFEASENKETRIIEKEVIDGGQKVVVSQEAPAMVNNFAPIFQGFSCSFKNKTDHSQFSVEVCTTPPVPTAPPVPPISYIATVQERPACVTREKTIQESSEMQQKSKNVEVKESKMIQKQAEEVVQVRPKAVTATLRKPETLPSYQKDLQATAEADLILMERRKRAEERIEQQKREREQQQLEQQVNVQQQQMNVQRQQQQQQMTKSVQQQQQMEKSVQQQRMEKNVQQQFVQQQQQQQMEKSVQQQFVQQQQQQQQMQKNVQQQKLTKPIIKIEPGDENMPHKTSFQPILDDKPGSTTFSPRPRSITPSMINKAPALLPYYQDNLVPHFHPAISTNLFDPAHPEASRSPSPHPGKEPPRSPSPLRVEAREARAKSPAEGPPPNPLQSKQPLPTPQDSKIQLAKESLKTYIPEYKSQRDVVEQQKGLDFCRRDSYSQNIAYPSDQVQSGSVQQQISDIQRNQTQISGLTKKDIQEKIHQEHLEASRKSQSQSTEMLGGGVQVQRRKMVTEEFERSHKEQNIQIETSSVTSKKAFERANVSAIETPSPQSFHITDPHHATSSFKQQSIVGSCQRQCQPQQQQQPSQPQQQPFRPQQQPPQPQQQPPQLQPQQQPSSQPSSQPPIPPTIPPIPPVRKVIPPGTLNKHSVAASSVSCQKPSEIVNPPNSDVGSGTGRQTGGITAAPKRGRGLLNTSALPGGRVALCGQCHGQIRGPFITALGKIWCPQHFVCATPSCKRPLQDLGFVEERGQLYCEYCFEQYLAPTCSKCNGKVKGDCLKAIGKNFHPECFNCVYCGKLFGNNPFFLEDGNPYCDADWNELFTTKCFACGFPVEAGDRWVEALNNNYHSQCFNCTMCKKNLEGQSFFAKGGRPFCKNHAR